MTVFADPAYSSTYQGLCNKIADTLNRQDLTSSIPDFTLLATKRIQRDMARIKHPAAISQAISTVANNYAPVPQDFISVYQIMTQDAKKIIHYVSPDQSMVFLANMSEGSTSNVGGGIIYYTIIGKQLRVFQPSTKATSFDLELWYFAALPEINTVTSTNWVLTRYPDLYLYGSLVHSAPYLKADDRIQTWESAYQKILSEVELEADQALRSQTKLSATRRFF